MDWSARGWESRRVRAHGVELHCEIRGSGAPLLVLHGFTGSTRSMRATAESLGDAFRTVCVDLVGHGRSEAPWDPTAYWMDRCVAQLHALLDALELPRVHLLGYSMGGRVALALCNAHPERVTSAVLIGASAGIEAHDQRDARRRADEALAARIEADGIEDFVDDWMAQPLFASQRRLSAAALAEARTQRLENRPHGLALSLRGMGTAAQPQLWNRLPAIHTPICLVVGAEDAKFCGIAEALAMRLPRARTEVVPDAGHAVHLESPERFAAIARRFFGEVGDGETSSPPPPHTPNRNQERETPMPTSTSAVNWKVVRSYDDIRFEKSDDGIAKITICRPEVRNAFRPRTLFELIDAFSRAREDQSVGVVLFTGEGPDAFCSGGDQKVRGDAGYVGDDGVPRLNALDLQRVIRTLPKPVIALVAGYAIGGGHVLHLVCDLTIAAENARFGQTGPRVGSFDAGFGASYLARVVGQKKAREIWYLCRQYGAQQALDMGLVNDVVPIEALEETGVEWARQILRHSPIAIRCLKSAFNADCDGQAGVQELAGNATMLFYMSEEAQEGRNAFVEKREPDFSRFPWRP